jgi:nucleotide-binding universal stress UspA family protein
VRAEGVPATIEVVIGELVPGSITEYARRVGADLIAIATHGRGGFARVIHGSVADGVTKSAMSSILVFHPEKVPAGAKLEGERGEAALEEVPLPA